MPPLFGQFKVGIDPWEVDHGSETPLEPIADQCDYQVTLDIEISSDHWEYLTPGIEKNLSRVYFIDGVRRLETRLVVRHSGDLLHGGFGSYAVGSVEVRPGQAVFGEMNLGREAILGSGQCLPQDVPIRHDLIYSSRSADETEPDAALRAIQTHMRQAEAHLARRLATIADSLVITDGPLGAVGHGNAVGLIKRVSRLYLPNHMLPLLTSMPARSRTPLFAIRSSHSGYGRLSWFVRLAEVRLGESDLHGLIRLEVSERTGRDDARIIADLTTVLLPRFAPPRGRDPRSPQNLIPIGALEQQLRHALGDQRLVRRWIETLIATEAAHVRT